MRDTFLQALKASVRDSKSPGAVGYVGDERETYFFGAYGDRQTEPARLPAEKDTIYDVASLTKVVATTTALLLLREDGALDLDQPASEHVPIPAFGRFTIRHLMTHTAGLAAVKPLYRTATSLDEMLQQCATFPLESEPGARFLYSDLGFMILGRIVELAGRDSLDHFCHRRIFQPLGLADTGFNPPEAAAKRCAATERCAWRGRLIQGAVHDENAAAVGGVAGHAGMFTTAEDLAVFCRALLDGRILKPAVVEEMTRLDQTPCYPWQGLGWRLDPWSTKTLGFLPSRTAFGHTGWTGCSMWIDRATGLFALLLGNTCHPSRATRDHESFRWSFHDAAAKVFYPMSANTHTGLDRLIYEHFRPVRGRRMALLTNHSATDQLGRHILDALKLDADVRLRALYTPEHGLHGTHEAGASVPSEQGPAPIRSLYGDRKRPTREELAEIDLFVVDLQDVGSRYYTYAATMKDCMSACAETGTAMLVLDRPNPVGGAVLEGPIAENADSPVCWGRVPARHGMTLGEIAMFFRARESGLSKLRLSVNALDTWSRERLFDECALPWTPPSPNIPTPETALVYVGTCLFEGTNLNEGRGTDHPFQVFGAPWLDAAAIIDEIAPDERTGCDLEAVDFTPRSIPGRASNPRFRDQVCRGVRIHVRRPHEARPFTLALALLGACRRRHADAFEWTPFFDVLAGSAALREALDRGDAARAIVERSAATLEDFDKKRPRLYS